MGGWPRVNLIRPWGNFSLRVVEGVNMAEDADIVRRLTSEARARRRLTARRAFVFSGAMLMTADFADRGLIDLLVNKSRVLLAASSLELAYG